MINRKETNPTNLDPNKIVPRMLNNIVKSDSLVNDLLQENNPNTIYDILSFSPLTIDEKILYMIKLSTCEEYEELCDYALDNYNTFIDTIIKCDRFKISGYCFDDDDNHVYYSERNSYQDLLSTIKELENTNVNVNFVYVSVYKKGRKKPKYGLHYRLMPTGDKYTFELFEIEDMRTKSSILTTNELDVVSTYEFPHKLTNKRKIFKRGDIIEFDTNSHTSNSMHNKHVTAMYDRKRKFYFIANDQICYDTLYGFLNTLEENCSMLYNPIYDATVYRIKNNKHAESIQPEDSDAKKLLYSIMEYNKSYNNKFSILSNTHGEFVSTCTISNIISNTHTSYVIQITDHNKRQDLDKIASRIELDFLKHRNILHDFKRYAANYTINTKNDGDLSFINISILMDPKHAIEPDITRLKKRLLCYDIKDIKITYNN